MLKRAISLAVAFALGGAGVASAQAMQHPAGHKRTISGTVVDVSCKFGLGLSGDGHRQCAQVCAGKGIPLAILGTDGKLYIPTSQAMPGDAQNERLTEFAEQQVTVTGTVFEAGGANAIWIDTVKKKA
jgi:hypothetical protein